LILLCKKDIPWRRGCNVKAGRPSYCGNAYLDDKSRGHGGQVLLQSQFEIFINLIWNQERHRKGIPDGEGVKVQAKTSA
jgi:hypothetical protein